MDDELEMDASGCWVRKSTQLMSETPFRSYSEDYNRLAYSPGSGDTVDNEKQDDALIIW
jgi:hypothetical protein